MGIKTELPWLPELKPGWKQSRLKDIILDMHSGGTPDSKVAEYYCDWEETTKGIPWCSIGDIPKGRQTLERTYRRITEQGMKNKKLRIVPAGTILYSFKASLGEVCFPAMETTTNEAIAAIYENPKIIDKNYLYYYLLSLRENLHYFANTNIQNNLNQEILGNLIIVYPESLEEQRRIAKELKKKDDLIEGVIKLTSEKIDYLKKRWESILYYNIFGKATVDNSVIFLESEAVKGYKKYRLKDILDKIYAGGTPDSKIEEYYADWEEIEKGTPWCSISDIPKKSNILEKTARRVTSKGLENKKLKVVSKGTILYSIKGSLGESCITGMDTFITENMLAIEGNSLKVKNWFLFYYLVALKPYLSYFANSNVLSSMNQDIVKNIIVFLPESLDTQENIVKNLLEQETKIKKMIGLLEEKNVQLNNYKKIEFIMKTSGQ